MLLVSWNTKTDEFEDGQWLRGRIYERRGDLSPDGTLLLYFAANWKQPYQSWTAVSRPPYLTALALWPKGDGWGGGGHFENAHRIALNHRAGEMELADDFRTPKWLRVTPLGEYPGWGEDNPVWAARLMRDGWTLVGGTRHKEDRKGRVWITYDPPIAWEKKHPIWPERYLLRMMIRGIKEREGPWYVTDHAIEDLQTHELTTLRQSDWADWSHNGDLLYARRGKLFRCVRKPDYFSLTLDERLLQDFADREFRERAAPPAAARWPGK